jgi:Cft2 family RNA processing exonuclease
MRPLVEAMALHLTTHRSHLSSTVPPILRPFINFSKKTLLADHQAKVLEGVWKGRSFRCVDETVKSWIDVNPDVKADVESRAVMSGASILALVKAQNSRPALASLACMLWAFGLEDPDRARLFQILIGLFQREVRPTAPRDVHRSTDQVREAQEETRQVRKTLRSAMEARKRLEKQLKSAQVQVAQLARSAQGAAHDQKQLEKQLSDASSKLARSESRLRKQSDENEGLTKAEAKAGRQRDAAHEELAVARLNLATAIDRETTLMSERSEVSKQLEAAEGRAHELEAPGGFWTFLVTTESALEDDVTRLQGADGLRAKDKLAGLRKLKRAFLETYPEFKAPRPVAAPTIVHRGPLSYRGLGGAEGIGASAYLIELAGHKILIDCGIKVGADVVASAPDISELESLDAVVITHAHTDHVGWLPALARQLGGFEIIATKQTHALIHVMLDDAHKRLQMELDQKRLYQRHAADPQEITEPYNDNDVRRVLYRVHPVGWGEEIQLRRGLTISLEPAGHILGAASVLLEGDGRKVVVSGDYATFGQRTVDPARWPEHFQHADLLISESTYGAANHPTRESEVDRLVGAVRATIRGGGTAIIPCFALGRAQEVLSILADAVGKGSLDAVPVWIDGMIQRIDRVYRDYGWRQLPPNFSEVRAAGLRTRDVIEACRKQPAIVVTTSGMLTGGPGVEYAAALLADARNRLYFTGYLDEESPGKRMLGLTDQPGRKDVTVEDESGKKKQIHIATPPKAVQLSAHSDQAGLVEQLTAYEPGHVVLVHGEDRARQALGSLLERKRLKVAPSSLEFKL